MMEKKEQQAGQFLVSTDKKMLQMDVIHAFLSKEAYWCKHIPLEVMKKPLKIVSAQACIIMAEK